MVRIMRIMLILLCFCLLLFAGLIAGTSVSHSAEIEERMEDLAGANLLDSLRVTDRNGVPLYDGDFSENEITRLSTFHVLGDQNGSLPVAVLSQVRNHPVISKFTGYHPEDIQVRLTIDLDLQNAAYSLLANQGAAGAVVVINYRLGEVVAMTSTPSVDAFNPGVYQEGAFLSKAQLAYVPGSTMKTVTAAAALEKNAAAAKEFTYNCLGADEYATCIDGVAHGEQTLAQILRNSCNCGIGALARSLLTPEEFNGYATAFCLLNGKVPVDYPSQEGMVDATEDLTWSSVGQSKDLVTPVGMCAFYGAIANDGILVDPHVDGRTEAGSTSLMKAETAEYLSQTLAAVAKDVGISCGAFGKTGTAEVDGGEPHSWFVCCLTGDEVPPYAIAVFLEHGGSSDAAVKLLADFVNGSIAKGGAA